MEERRRANRLLLGKSEGKRLLVGLGVEEDNINMDFQEN
jgi:hypothetical protein